MKRKVILKGGVGNLLPMPTVEGAPGNARSRVSIKEFFCNHNPWGGLRGVFGAWYNGEKQESGKIMKKIFCLLLVFTLLLSGCAGQPQISGRQITDGAGRKVIVPEKVERVVCVGVGALRYTCYLGAADLVVGVEDYEKEESLQRLYNYVNFEKFKDIKEIKDLLDDIDTIETIFIH